MTHPMQNQAPGAERNEEQAQRAQEQEPQQVQGEQHNQGEEHVQGEGDYEASRHYREEVSQFLEHADVDALARQAAPASALEARELALAEDRAAVRSKGDDPADVGAMYPGRSTSDR